MTRETESPPPPSMKFVPRLLAVASVAALGQLWVRHHLGLGGDTPWVAALVVVVGVIDTILGKFLPKAAKEDLDAQIREKLAPVITGRLAMLVCAAVVLTALFLSSVTVIPGSTGDRLTARLSNVDGRVVHEQTLGPDKSPVRFAWLYTSPFGRPYRLAVDGYVEEAVTVYPMVGLTVNTERDLRRSPSVLFRPSTAAVQSLASGGKFMVTWRSASGLAQPLAPPQSGHEGAFLIGRDQSVPAAISAAWRLDLTAASVQEPTLSQMLQRWRQVRVIKPVMPLAPGMTLVAEVQSRRTDVVEIVARAEVVVGTDALIDVPLLAVHPGG